MLPKCQESIIKNYGLRDSLLYIEIYNIKVVTQGADPQAKVLERVANRSNAIGICKHSNTCKRDYNNIINENNQRSAYGRIEKFTDQLKNIPWT